MECSSCGTNASADAEFCSGCGARLGKSGKRTRVPRPELGKGFLLCPQCGNGPGSDFCNFFGLSLEGGTGSPSRRKREAPEPFAGSIEPVDLRGAGLRLRFCAAAVDGILLILLTLVTAWLAGLPIAVSLLAIGLLYRSLGVSARSTTVGESLPGPYAQRSNGSKCAFRRAARRWFSCIVSAPVLFIGYVMIGLRQDKRGLRGLICDTAVVSGPASRT